MKKILIILTLLFLVSCEGYIKLRGIAYDYETKKPLSDVEVSLILNEGDTLKYVELEYDTLAYEKRMQLRKQGIKDDYDFNDPNGLSRYKVAMTNESGEFRVGNMLVGCVPKCPKCELVFVLDGYETRTYKPQSIMADSIIVYLKKR